MGDDGHRSDTKCIQFVLSAPTLQALDLIELSFRVVIIPLLERLPPV